MTPRQVKKNRPARISDPVRFAVRMTRGENPPRIIGAGGHIVPRAALDQTGIIVADADHRRRVLLHWPEHGDVGVWIDAELIEPAK